MPDVITAINYALNNDMKRMDNIAQNVANVNTQSYKRVQISQPAFGASLDSLNATDSQVAQPVQITDMSQGAIKFTGNSFHIALKGRGMMQVGEGDALLFTRKGEMMIDAEGRLCLTNGTPVLGENGFIHLRSEPFQIEKTGEVKQGDVVVDRISIVELENDADWSARGEGLYVLTEDVVMSEKPDTLVMQNYLESANVNTAEEMIQMIEITRHFQATHQILKGYDGMLDDAINTIGDF